jgi:23S rRNA-/tRNA-specific pseudouridylate synthase
MQDIPLDIVHEDKHILVVNKVYPPSPLLCADRAILVSACNPTRLLWGKAGDLVSGRC